MTDGVSGNTNLIMCRPSDKSLIAREGGNGHEKKKHRGRPDGAVLSCVPVHHDPARTPPAAMVSPLEASASPTLRRVLESDVLAAPRPLRLPDAVAPVRGVSPAHDLPPWRGPVRCPRFAYRGYALPAYVLSINHPQLRRLSCPPERRFGSARKTEISFGK
jgi:hypothetical protein